MSGQTRIEKYKREALEIIKKRRVFLIIGSSLLGTFLIFLIIGLVMLNSAVVGDHPAQVSYIFIFISFLFLIAGMVMLILSKVLFIKKLKEVENLINKTMKEMSQNKPNHHFEE